MIRHLAAACLVGLLASVAAAAAPPAEEPWKTGREAVVLCGFTPATELFPTREMTHAVIHARLLLDARPACRLAVTGLAARGKVHYKVVKGRKMLAPVETVQGNEVLRQERIIAADMLHNLAVRYGVIKAVEAKGQGHKGWTGYQRIIYEPDPAGLPAALAAAGITAAEVIGGDRAEEVRAVQEALKAAGIAVRPVVMDAPTRMSYDAAMRLTALDRDPGYELSPETEVVFIYGTAPAAGTIGSAGLNQKEGLPYPRPNLIPGHNQFWQDYHVAHYLKSNPQIKAVITTGGSVWRIRNSERLGMLLVGSGVCPSRVLADSMVEHGSTGTPENYLDALHIVFECGWHRLLHLSHGGEPGYAPAGPQRIADALAADPRFPQAGLKYKIALQPVLRVPGLIDRPAGPPTPILQVKGVEYDRLTEILDAADAVLDVTVKQIEPQRRVRRVTFSVSAVLAGECDAKELLLTDWTRFDRKVGDRTLLAAVFPAGGAGGTPPPVWMALSSHDAFIPPDRLGEVKDRLAALAEPARLQGLLARLKAPDPLHRLLAVRWLSDTRSPAMAGLLGEVLKAALDPGIDQETRIGLLTLLARRKYAPTAAALLADLKAATPQAVAKGRRFYSAAVGRAVPLIASPAQAEEMLAMYPLPQAAPIRIDIVFGLVRMGHAPAGGKVAEVLLGGAGTPAPDLYRQEALLGCIDVRKFTPAAAPLAAALKRLANAGAAGSKLLRPMLEAYNHIAGTNHTSAAQIKD